MKIDRSTVTAWQQRRLVFSATPLGRIVRKFNRYSPTRRMRVEGDELALPPFGGVFEATDPSPLIEFVAASDPSINIERDGTELVIRQDRPPQQ